MIDVLINLFVGILSQCRHISNHHVVHSKYITILFIAISYLNEGEKKSLNPPPFYNSLTINETMVQPGTAKCQQFILMKPPKGLSQIPIYLTHAK